MAFKVRKEHLHLLIRMSYQPNQTNPFFIDLITWSQFYEKSFDLKVLSWSNFSSWYIFTNDIQHNLAQFRLIQPL